MSETRSTHKNTRAQFHCKKKKNLNYLNNLNNIFPTLMSDEALVLKINNFSIQDTIYKVFCYVF